jgi:hypothetical protein
MTTLTKERNMDLEKYNPLKAKESDQSMLSLPEKTRTTEAIGMSSDVSLSQLPVIGPMPAILKDWSDSASVIRLIEYMNKYPGQGVILFERGGVMGLRFEPGINAEALKSERGKIAGNMFSLLQDAVFELKTMITHGIELPFLIRDALPSGSQPFSNSRVLPRALERHGTQTPKKSPLVKN